MNKLQIFVLGVMLASVVIFGYLHFKLANKVSQQEAVLVQIINFLNRASQPK